MRGIYIYITWGREAKLTGTMTSEYPYIPNTDVGRSFGLLNLDNGLRPSLPEPEPVMLLLLTAANVIAGYNPCIISLNFTFADSNETVRLTTDSENTCFQIFVEDDTGDGSLDPWE